MIFCFEKFIEWSRWSLREEFDMMLFSSVTLHNPDLFSHQESPELWGGGCWVPCSCSPISGSKRPQRSLAGISDLEKSAQTQKLRRGAFRQNAAGSSGPSPQPRREKTPGRRQPREQTSSSEDRNLTQRLSTSLSVDFS